MEKTFEQPGFYFQWHFLETCNLRCKHCYQEGYEPQRADLGLVYKTLKQIEKALCTWDMIGRVSVTGGEPLLDTDALFVILDGLTKIERVAHIGILTNGTLLTEELASRLSRYKKLREIQISLDGASAVIHDETRGKGNFDKAVRGLKLLKNAGIPSAVMFTATKINSFDAVPVIKLAEKLGVDAISIERYTPFHEKNDPLALTAMETKQIFESVIEEKSAIASRNGAIKVRTSRPLWNLLSCSCGGVCPVGYSCLTIMHDGSVYPCRRLPILLGTIQNDGIFKIWYTSPILRRLRQRDEIDKCSSCEKNSVCGGCRAASFADSGNFMGRDPLCWKE